MIKWLGYAPDVSEKQPGAWTTCDNVVPTTKGFAGAPAPQTGELNTAVATTVQGASIVRKLDDSIRVFVGTSSKLYEASTTSWTDRTRASGGDYTLGETTRWRFAQFNDNSLAISKSDTLQVSTTGAFSDVSGAPKAALIETARNFVVVANYDDGTDTPNGWFCAALGSHSDWTPSVSTQCANGLISDTQGKITALKRFGEGLIAYKLNSMYIGVYVGPPSVWEWRLLPGQIGALSQEAVVDIGTTQSPRHAFMGPDDFYIFDGARAVPVGTGRLKETFHNEINRTKQELATAIHDEDRSIIYWYYSSSDTTNGLDKCVAWNYKTNTFGRANRNIQFAFDYITPSSTYVDVGDLASLYGDLPETTYGTGFLAAVQPVPAVFSTGQVLQTLTGPCVTSTLTTGDHGDDDQFTLLHAAKVTYESNPTSSQMTNFYKLDSGDDDTQDQTVTASGDKFHVLRSARWHRLRFDFTGGWEGLGHRVGLRKDGSE
jgi:hypothetical protein